MQILIVLMEPSEDADDISLKGGNMILNRFCIDEDAAFELSGVNYLKTSSRRMRNRKKREFKAERKEKGKDYPFIRFETVLLQFYELYLHK